MNVPCRGISPLWTALVNEEKINSEKENVILQLDLILRTSLIFFFPTDGAPTSSASGWHSSSESMLGASGTSHILDMKGHKTETDDVEFITSGDSSSSSLSSDE